VEIGTVDTNADVVLVGAADLYTVWLAYRGLGAPGGGWVGELRLEVREYQDETRWRWVLTEAGGALVADHEVQLDRGCWQFEAFGNLLGYLGWHAVAVDFGKMAAWDPVIAALLAADGGDMQAPAALDTELDRYQEPSWAVLVAALRRVQSGGIGDDVLTGLNEIDAAIVTRALGASDGNVNIPLRSGLPSGCVGGWPTS
jgi:hypothetical protein